MKILKTIALVAATLFANHAIAQTITIEPGSSVLIDQDNPPDRVRCEGNVSTGPLQTATRKICGGKTPYGDCQFFNEVTISGKYCATGKKCGNETPYGDCQYYNILAECGSNACSVSKVCGKLNPYGDCQYWNEIPTCN